MGCPPVNYVKSPRTVRSFRDATNALERTLHYDAAAASESARLAKMYRAAERIARENGDDAMAARMQAAAEENEKWAGGAR